MVASNCDWFPFDELIGDDILSGLVGEWSPTSVLIATVDEVGFLEYFC